MYMNMNTLWIYDYVLYFAEALMHHFCVTGDRVYMIHNLLLGFSP